MNFKEYLNEQLSITSSKKEAYFDKLTKAYNMKFLAQQNINKYLDVELYEVKNTSFKYIYFLFDNESRPKNKDTTRLYAFSLTNAKISLNDTKRLFELLATAQLIPNNVKSSKQLEKLITGEQRTSKSKEIVKKLNVQTNKEEIEDIIQNYFNNLFGKLAAIDVEYEPGRMDMTITLNQKLSSSAIENLGNSLVSELSDVINLEHEITDPGSKIYFEIV